MTDARVGSFLADVLALEGENPDTIRDVALGDCEEVFKAQEVNRRMKGKAAHACRALCRARILEDMRRRSETYWNGYDRAALSSMDDPAVTAKQLVDLAQKHIEDHQRRIAWQRELVAKYERDDDTARLPTSRRVLERMQKQLAQMTAAHAAAEEHLSKLTVDEPSVEKVVRDTPM
jgi:hypothetical protein